MPSRRAVLIGGTVAAGAVAVLGLSIVDIVPPDDGTLEALSWDRPDADRLAALKRHLRAHFDYLQIPDATLDRFGDDLLAHGTLPKTPNALAGLRRDFLMCTDFFLHDGDEGRPLAYVAWYDPYVTPCWNPLARPA